MNYAEFGVIRRRRQDCRRRSTAAPLVVIAVEQHATPLVVPASQRTPATWWSSHRDHAAKALRKLAGPHLPATLTKLEQAVKRAHTEYEQAETTAREQNLNEDDTEAEELVDAE